MPDYEPADDDDENAFPHFNDTGEFGDLQYLIESDDDED